MRMGGGGEVVEIGLCEINGYGWGCFTSVEFVEKEEKMKEENRRKTKRSSTRTWKGNMVCSSGTCSCSFLWMFRPRSSVHKDTPVFQ